MKKIHLFMITKLLILFSCNGQNSTVIDPTVELKEGKLTYHISGVGTTPDWELEILFDSNNVRINAKYAFGAGRQYIYDKKINEILGLFDEASFFGNNSNQYFIYYTLDKFISNESSHNYGDTTIITTQDFKEILGYKCQKSIIKHGSQVIVEVWLTDKIKPGLIYPWTPLTFDKIALEYELKILGKTECKYIVKSISNEKIEKKEFEHSVPDPYYLVIPAYVFSIDSMWSNDYQENTYKSFTYPYFRDSRETTLKFVKDGIYKIVPKNKVTNIIIDFFVNRDGTISDIEISVNYSNEDKRIEEIKKFIHTMKEWTPAMVKGKAVKSKVSIIA